MRRDRVYAGIDPIFKLMWRAWGRGSTAFGRMGETFKDYVIEMYRVEDMDPAPGEPGYQSESEDEDVVMAPVVDPKSDEYKDMILARLVDPDDIQAINDLSRALVPGSYDADLFREQVLPQFQKTLRRPFGDLLVRPLFDFLGIIGDNLLIVSAINLIIKYHPSLMNDIPVDASNVRLMELNKLRAKKSPRTFTIMDTIPEELDEVVPPIADTWVVRYKQLFCSKLAKKNPLSPQKKLSGQPQKKARMCVDLTCTESMV